MIKEKKSCLFCDSSDLSKEHIYSSWIVNHFEPVNKTFKPSLHIVRRSNSNKAIDTLQNDISDGRKIPYKNFIIKRICTGCNNGWMSALENEVKPLLLRHLDDPYQPFDFSSSEAHLLSQWSIMKCMLASLTSPKKVFFPNVMYRLIKNGIIPEGFLVEFGKMKYQNLNFVIGGLQVRKAFDMSREELDKAMNNFFKASLQIGYAGFRISFLRTEIPVFRRQIGLKLGVLHPYNAKILFQDSVVKDLGSKIELPFFNDSLAIADS